MSQILSRVIWNPKEERGLVKEKDEGKRGEEEKQETRKGEVTVISLYYDY